MSADGEPEAAVERHFDANGWGDGFRGDTFPFHHYHSIAHEVVGCARGAQRSSNSADRRGRWST